VAGKENKVDGNVPGKFDIDDQCIDCNLCKKICPDCFGRDEEAGSFVAVE
jgi:ferredoxin